MSSPLSSAISLREASKSSVGQSRDPAHGMVLKGRRTLLAFRPELRRDYPLNLSISLSGGKETNQDSPSNGE